MGHHCPGSPSGSFCPGELSHRVLRWAFDWQCWRETLIWRRDRWLCGMRSFYPDGRKRQPLSGDLCPSSAGLLSGPALTCISRHGQQMDSNQGKKPTGHSCHCWFVKAWTKRKHVLSEQNTFSESKKTALNLVSFDSNEVLGQFGTFNSMIRVPLS